MTWHFRVPCARSMVSPPAMAGTAVAIIAASWWFYFRRRPAADEEPRENAAADEQRLDVRWAAPPPQEAPDEAPRRAPDGPQQQAPHAVPQQAPQPPEQAHTASESTSRSFELLLLVVGWFDLDEHHRSLPLRPLWVLPRQEGLLCAHCSTRRAPPRLAPRCFPVRKAYSPIALTRFDPLWI